MSRLRVRVRVRGPEPEPEQFRVRAWAGLIGVSSELGVAALASEACKHEIAEPRERQEGLVSGSLHDAHLCTVARSDEAGGRRTGGHRVVQAE